MNNHRLNLACIEVSPLHCIDGERAASPDTFELRRPIDQALLGNIAEGTVQHVEAARRSAPSRPGAP